MRTLLVVASLVALLVIACTFVALHQVNAYLEAHRADLAAQAAAALGRPVSFDAAHASLGAGVTITVSNLRIGDDPRFGGEDFLQAPSVSAGVELLPALFGSVRILRVALQAPVITVVRSIDGLNVDSLGRTAPATAPTTASLPASASVTPPAPISVEYDNGIPSIAALVIRDGRLRIIDRRIDPPAAVSIADLDLTAHDLSPHAPIRFTLRAAPLGAARQTLSAHGAFAAGADTPLTLDAEVSDLAIDDLKQTAGVASFIPPALSSSGPIRATLHAEGTRAQLTLALRADATAAPLRYANLLDKAAGVALVLDSAGTLATDPAAVEISRGHLTLAGLVADVTGSVQGSDPPRVDLAARVSPTSLSELATVLPGLVGRDASGSVAADLRAQGPVTATGVAALTGQLDLQQIALGSPNMPGRLSGLSAPIVFAGDSATLAPTSVRIGDAPAALGCRATPLADPVVTCSLTADALSGTSLGMSAEEGNVQALRVQIVAQPATPDAMIQTTLRADRVDVHALTFTAVEVDARVRRNEYVVDRGTAHLFEGTVNGSGTYRVSDAGAAYDVRATADGVRIGPLLASQGRADAERVDGRLQLTTALTGRAREPSALAAALNGSGRMVVTDGMVRGVDLGADSLGPLAGLASPRVRRRHPDLFGGDLRFDRASASFRIADQRVTTQDAQLQSSDVNVNASGDVTFIGGIDLQGTLRLSPALTGDLLGGSGVARVLTDTSGGLDLPFEVHGTVAKPRLRLTAGAVAKLVGHGVQDLIDGGTEGGERAGELLKGLHNLFKH